MMKVQTPDDPGRLTGGGETLGGVDEPAPDHVDTTTKATLARLLEALTELASDNAEAFTDQGVQKAAVRLCATLIEAMAATIGRDDLEALKAAATLDDEAGR